MTKTHNSPLERIVFVSIPEETPKKIKDFQLDPRILLPVEIPPGEETWNPEDLSWEMIISAMLKIFAWNPEHENIEYYRSFIYAMRPDLEGEMSRVGVLKAKNNDLEIAREIFMALYNLNRKNIANAINLALVLEEMAENFSKQNNHSHYEFFLDKAFQVYRDAASIHEDSTDLLFNLGNFYIKRGNMGKARETLQKFIHLEPEGNRSNFVKELLSKIPEKSEDDLLFMEAYDLIKMEREDAGIEKIKLFLENNPDVWNAWFLLGWAYRRKGRYKEASEAFLHSIELEDSNPDTYNELAICLMETGEYTSCRKYLKKALSLDGENTRIISNFGVLALKENNLEEARGFFNVVLEYSPDDEIAKKYLNFMNQKK